MNKTYIHSIIHAICAVVILVMASRTSTHSRQSEYWHGKYDQAVDGQSRTDSIAGAYQMSLVALIDSTSKRAIEKETVSNVTATKIKNRSNTEK